MRGIVLLAIAATACTAAPPADRDVRLARLAGQQREILDQLEDLQARLLVDGERVRFWQEMRERHESISAISCNSQETHAVAMAERLAPQETAQAAGSRLRARVAAAHAAPGRPAAKR